MTGRIMTAMNTSALAEHAQAIRTLGKRVVEDIVEIGRHLSEARKLFGARGDGWEDWLHSEFGWSGATALNFIRVYDLSKMYPLMDAKQQHRSAKSFGRLPIPISALYLLANPSTPPAVRTELLTRAESGERLSHQEVAVAINQAKATIAAETQEDDDDDQNADVFGVQSETDEEWPRTCSCCACDLRADGVSVTFVTLDGAFCEHCIHDFSKQLRAGRRARNAKAIGWRTPTITEISWQKATMILAGDPT
jgi:hypothetical protein